MADHPSHRLLLVILLMLWLIGCMRPSTPNVVVYLIDTLRADHLSSYGYARETSPVIDSLASRGVRFERAYAPDTRTLGSVPSLLTSLHVPSHGVDRFGDAIAEDVLSLAQVFSRHGYHTASFVTNINAGRLPGLDRGFTHFHDAIASHRDPYASRTFPEAAFFDWLDQLPGGPFFAYVHTAEPHRPYIAPEPFAGLFSTGYSGLITGYFRGPHGFHNAKTPEEIAHVTALYDGEIRFADDSFGKLLRGLIERNLDRDTVLFVTSDHGEELFDRGGWNHGHSLYDELLHVPLIITGPGVPSGQRIHEPVQLVDVAPTVLDLVGLPVPQEFEGESLAPLMFGDLQEHFRARSLFAMATQPPIKMAVIQERYKCILTPGDAPILYDLLADPKEQNNLALERVGTLRVLFEQLRTWAGAAPGVKDHDVRSLSPQEEQRLRALGYLE